VDLSVKDEYLTSMTVPQRIELTQYIISVLESWGLNSKQIISLLDLPGKNNVRVLNRYRQGNELPRCEQVNLRLDYILAIVDALRTSFPRNAHMAPHWMKKPLKRFNKRPPVALLVEDGFGGLQAVRAHLDCSYEW